MTCIRKVLSGQKCNEWVTASLVCLLLPALFNSGRAALTTTADQIILQGPIVTKLDWNIRAPRFGDLNGDSLPDVALINNNQGKIEFLIQKTDDSHSRKIGQTSKAKKWEPALEDDRFNKSFLVIDETVYDLGLADFNQDGLLDLVMMGNRDSLSIFLQEQDGDFKKSWTFDEFDPKQRGRSIWIEDINQDQQLDLIIIGSNEILVMLKSAENLAFDITQFHVPENSAWNLNTADLNQDGRRDLIYYHSSQNAQFLAFRLQTGAGRFGPEVPIPFFSAIYSRLPYQFSKSDSFIYVEGRTGHVKSFNLQRETYHSSQPFSEIQSFTYPLNSVVRNASLYTWGDLNHDGLTDIVVGDPEGAQIQVFFQEDSGHFSAQKNFPSFAYIDGVSITSHPQTGQTILFMISEKERMAGISQIDAEENLPFPTLLPLEGDPVALLSGPGQTPNTPGLVLVEKIDRNYHLTEYQLDRANHWKAQSIQLKNIKNKPRGLMFCRLEKDSAFLVILGQREPAGFFKKTVTGWVEIADKAPLRKTLLFSLSTDRFSIADMDGDGIDELFIADTGFLRKIVYDPVEDDFSIARQYNTPKRKQDARIPVPYQRKNGNSLVYFDPKDDHLFLIGEKEPTNLRGNNQKEVPPIIPLLGRNVDLGNGRSALLLAGERRFYLLPDRGDRWTIEYKKTFFEPETPEVHYDFLLTLERMGGKGADIVGIDSNRHLMELFSVSVDYQWHSKLEFTLFDQVNTRGSQQRNIQPKDAGIYDLTGDGKDDIVLLVHDRMLIYY